MLEELKDGARVVGAKETRRALSGGRALRVFVARDADPALTEPLARMARDMGVPVEETFTMAQLGRACGIAVGAAVAAAVK